MHHFIGGSLSLVPISMNIRLFDYSMLFRTYKMSNIEFGAWNRNALFCIICLMSPMLASTCSECIFSIALFCIQRLDISPIDSFPYSSMNSITITHPFMRQKFFCFGFSGFNELQRNIWLKNDATPLTPTGEKDEDEING